MFQSPIKLAIKYEVPLMRERDTSLMDAFIETGIWQIEQLERLNIVRRYKKVFSKSDILESDGQTVLSSMMDKFEGTSTWVFPKEKPRRTDLELWQSALYHLTSTTLTLMRPLGRYINPPHKTSGWYQSLDRQYLYRRCENGLFDAYRKSPDARLTRILKYRPCANSFSPPLILPYARYVTVGTTPHTDEVEVTSSADCIQPPPEEDRSIPDILRSQDNPDLWKHLDCEEDGWWIRDALLNGTLFLASDGSYQPDVDPNVCSCAFCLVCADSLRRISCTWAERSNCASNYRGELLGALGYLLILKAVLPNDRDVLVDISNLPVSDASCDNMGVVKHGRLPLKALSEKQVQSDILGHIKYLLRSLPARTRFTHVRAHMRKVLAVEDMTLEQILNDEMDTQAVDALVAAVRDNDFIITRFPHERITMQCGEERVTASPTEAIYDLSLIHI